MRFFPSFWPIEDSIIPPYPTKQQNSFDLGRKTSEEWLIEAIQIIVCEKPRHP
jgi:hypothetical protein